MSRGLWNIRGRSTGDLRQEYQELEPEPRPESEALRENPPQSTERPRPMTPGAARAITSKPRRKIVVPAARPRSRFRAVSPRVALRRQAAPTAASIAAGMKGAEGGVPRVYLSGGTRIAATVLISDHDVDVLAKGLDPEKIARFERIQQGVLPPEEAEAFPRPPTDDELNEREADAIGQIERWGRQAEAAVESDAAEERRSKYARADRLEAQADATDEPRRASTLRRQSTVLREQAESDYHRQTTREYARIADQVRSERAQVRAELRREADRRAVAYAERVTELQAGLDGEVEKEINRSYFHFGDPPRMRYKLYPGWEIV